MTAGEKSSGVERRLQPDGACYNGTYPSTGDLNRLLRYIPTSIMTISSKSNRGAREVAINTESETLQLFLESNDLSQMVSMQSVAATRILTGIVSSRSPPRHSPSQWSTSRFTYPWKQTTMACGMGIDCQHSNKAMPLTASIHLALLVGNSRCANSLVRSLVSAKMLSK